MTTKRAERVSEITDVALSALHVWERNPRTISERAFERLKRSLEADPSMLQARPVIARPDGTVVGGNMRLRAAESLGWETIPAVYVELSDEEAIEWALRDNRSYGEDDDGAVAELLYELQLRAPGQCRDFRELIERCADRVVIEFTDA